MKNLKIMLPVVMLLFLASCAAPVYNIRLESGRPLANPNYVLKDTTGETELMVTFWFTGFSTVIDKDGTSVYIPHTLTMDDLQELDESIVKVMVSIDMYNPNLLEYHVNYKIKSKTTGDDKHYSGYSSSKLAVSDLIFRHYSIELPLESVHEVLFSGDIEVAGASVFMLGPFQYRKGG